MKNSKGSLLVSARVYAYRKAPELPVQVSVSPEFLDMSDIAEGAITIEWKLVTRGYKFPDDGTAIVFTSPGSKEAFGPTDVTSKAKLKSINKTATVKVLARTGLAYAYTITVIDESTGLTAVLDPGAQLPS